LVPLGEVIRQRKQSILIDDTATYKRCRVQLHAKGIVLRDQVTGAEIKTKQQQVCRAGEFLVAEIDAKVGGFGIVPPELEGAIVSSHYFLFELDERRLERKFLDYFIRTPAFRDQVEAQGSTNYAAVRPKDVLAYQIPLPPLAEQRRIVARVDAIAARIEAARTLRQQAMGETNRVYFGALATFMQVSQQGWVQTTVQEIILGIDAGWSPRCEDLPAKEGEWGVLKTTSVQWCEFRPAENKRLPPQMKPRPEYEVREGDVLVTRAGPRKRVGVVAAVRQNAPNLTISDKLIRLHPNPNKLDSRFLELALASPFSQEHLVHRKTGLADAQVNISQAILLSTPIALPPLPEQRRIVAELDALQAKVDALRQMQEASGRELDALLPAVLDRAFKGQL